MIRRLNRTLSTLLFLAAFVIVVAIGFSDHSDDYGRVSLPQGGTVHLPEGKVTVYDRVREGASDQELNTAAVAFQVQPAAGAEPVAMRLENGDVSEDQVTRKETVGEFGAVAKLEVPKAGDYIVSGGTDLEPGTVYLDFGTNAGTALLDHWKLIAALMLGALLLALIPPPRRRRWREAPEPAWSSDPRAPYAG